MPPISIFIFLHTIFKVFFFEKFCISARENPYYFWGLLLSDRDLTVNKVNDILMPSLKTIWVIEHATTIYTTNIFSFDIGNTIKSCLIKC